MSSSTIATPATGPSSPAPASRGRQVLIGVVVLVILAIVAAVLHLRSGGDSKVPYSDVRSSGALTLCGTNGKPVTSGSTKAAPFIGRAVGATAAQGSAAGAGRIATLYAFQPRQGAETEEWSGQLLTAASTYTNVKHPMAQATKADTALRAFLIAFPPRWDGFVQLRLYLAAPGAGIAATYDTANIQIHGDTWKLVGAAGTASCTDGDATSNETTAGNGPTP
ncbi:MAG: hypothetical protein JWP74_3335 [Marmoricola sp.]|nr:hypothetical protein [Marmoricola sp.]